MDLHLPPFPNLKATSPLVTEANAGPIASDAVDRPASRRLSHVRADLIEPGSEHRRWLIDGLWGEQAVGVIGGEPKACKTFLALDMAVAVASGRPCLRRYPVANPGPVLLFAAEDSPGQVRRRLEGIATAAGVALNGLPLYVVTEAQLRLDLIEDQAALEATVVELRPRLLILDPFVRLHGGIGESSAAAVAPLLGFLRLLQRRWAVAVVLVHHARKGGSVSSEGQALRGSSDFHAWGDSNLYLRRSEQGLLLSIEQRAAPSESGIPLVLRSEGRSVALARCEPAGSESTSQPGRGRPALSTTEELILKALAQGALSMTELRRICGLRQQTVKHAVDRMVAAGTLSKRRGFVQLLGARGQLLHPDGRPG